MPRTLIMNRACNKTEAGHAWFTSCRYVRWHVRARHADRRGESIAHKASRASMEACKHGGVQAWRRASMEETVPAVMIN